MAGHGLTRWKGSCRPTRQALALVLHKREGVPNIMIMDGSKEQTLGQFCKKCCQAGSHMKQTEPYSQWSNAAKGSIRELKRGVGREMVRSQAPKQLWDDCLEREAYVRSLTALNVYGLSGQVPETIVSGETAHIPVCRFQVVSVDNVSRHDSILSG